jgi:hypothetical protein
MSTAVVPEPPPPPPPTQAFDFLRPFTFVFDDPQWIPKVLIGGLFFLASFVIVGVFFLYGYIARLTRNVIDGLPNPLPEWDDLGEYFSEGLKLFAVGLVYAIPIVIVVGLAIVPAAFVSSSDSDAARNIGGMSMACIYCLMLPLSLALALWLPAALLRVIVTREFSAAFEFSRIWQFIRENIGNYLLAIVVWLVARFAAGMGIVLCIVGVVFTGFWALTVAAHAFGQVYRLSRVK